MRYVRRYIEIAAQDKKMIVGVGDQVPPESDIRRVRWVAEVCEETEIK
jgi:hypothetical protein